MAHRSRSRHRFFVLLAAAACLPTVLAGPASLSSNLLPDIKPTDWQLSTELGYVVTGGNSSTSSFSLGANLSRSWTKSSLLVKSTMLRSFSVTTARKAVGTADDFDIVEEKSKHLQAENFMVSMQYDHKLWDGFLFQTGLSWDRNRFAGVSSRTILNLGAGYVVVATGKTQIKANAGFSFTRREYIVEDGASFAGFRLNLSAVRKIGEKSSASSQFLFDQNLKTMKDWRFDWTNSLAASLSKALALKTSLRILGANAPAQEYLPLIDPAGATTDDKVLVPLKRTDMFFTTSIVINF